MDLFAELQNLVAIVCFAVASWAVMLLRDRMQARVVREVATEDPRVLMRRGRAFNVEQQITWLTTEGSAPGSPRREPSSMR